MEDLLYKKFIKVNPKLSKEIFTFIVNNCHAKMIKNLTDEKSEMTLEDLKNNIFDRYFEECEGCKLCDKEVFKKKRSKLKKCARKISSLSNSEKIIELKKLVKETEDLFLVIKKNNNKYKLLIKALNLYSSILLNFINYSISKINAKKSEYFEQIARILLSTNKFIKDIEDAKNAYFNFNTDVFPDYDYIPKENKESKTINAVIEDIMKNYNMAKWWKGWIKSLLRYDVDKNLNKIMDSVPNNDIGLGKRKKPIYGPDFEKYLRCYQLREDDEELIDIFFSELDNYPNDWWEFKEYNNSKDIADQTKLEKQLVIRISKGINRLKSRIDIQK